MYKLNLVIGDWSDDGHGKTATVTIDSNMMSREVWDAYRAGARLIGVDLCKDVASDYQESQLGSGVASKFVAAGFADYELDSEDYMGSDQFADMFLFTVKKGNPDFSYTRCENEDLHIGGYGLFE